MEEELIVNNINLIYVVLKKMNLYSKFDEYFDIGMIGLVKGAKSFDPSKGYSASTYLYKCIYNEILMSFRHKEVETVSLETQINDDFTLSDYISYDEEIEEKLIQKEQIERLYDELGKLDTREQFILSLAFGLLGYKRLSQKEISDLLGVSQTTISRIIKRSLIKLRRKMTV